LSLLTIAATLLIASSCLAFTWHVEQDGSGDYEIIQNAVDVAAVGDTIMIGPGRYDQYWEFAPELQWWAVVGVLTDSLTFIGIDRDEVIIGTDYEYPVYPGNQDSHGITTRSPAPWMVVENITFENMKKGVRCHPGGEVRNCLFRSIADDAVFSEASMGACPECPFLVENCEFLDSRGSRAVLAIHNSNSTSSATIQRVNSYDGGGFYTSHPNAVIDDCVIEDSIEGIIRDGGVIHANNCIMRRTRSNIYAYGEPESTGIFCNNIRVEESSETDVLINGGRVEAENSVFTNEGDWGIVMFVRSTADFHNSHIFRNGAPYAVDLTYHQGTPDGLLHFENNWWGTADPDSVADMIYDHTDNNDINTTVLYEPILLGPSANKKKSFGGMKQLFR